MTYYSAEFLHLDKWPRLKRGLLGSRTSFSPLPLKHRNESIASLTLLEHSALWNPSDLTANLPPITSIDLFLFRFSSWISPAAHHVLPPLHLDIRVSSPLHFYILKSWRLFRSLTPPANNCCHGDRPKRGWPTVSGSRGDCWVLSTSLHFHACRGRSSREGLKCGHDPADGALLCGQTGVTGSRRSVEKVSRRAAWRHHIYPAPGQNTSLWQRSRSHPSCLDGPFSSFLIMVPFIHHFPLYSVYSVTTSRHMKHLKKHSCIIIHEKRQKQSEDTLNVENTLLSATFCYSDLKAWCSFPFRAEMLSLIAC